MDFGMSEKDKQLRAEGFAQYMKRMESQQSAPPPPAQPPPPPAASGSDQQPTRP
jgi:hypothetical protein